MIFLSYIYILTNIFFISGGVDSSCVAALLKTAQDRAKDIPNHPFNPSNGGRIVGVAQPFHSTPEIQNRAYEVGKDIGVSVITVNRSDEYDSSVAKVQTAIGENLKAFPLAMFKSYERTPINYLLAGHYGGVVVGTGNKDEDGYLYYYCKFGDGAVDLGLIWDLHKSQVFTVAKYLGVPQSVLDAPPSADLAPGQTDHEEIGATYDSVEYCTTYLEMTPEERIMETADLSVEALNQLYYEMGLIEAIHRRGMHKADLNPKNIGSQWFYDRYATNVPLPINHATTQASDQGEASLTLETARALKTFLTWSPDQQDAYTNFLSPHDLSVFRAKLALYRDILALN